MNPKNPNIKFLVDQESNKPLLFPLVVATLYPDGQSGRSMHRKHTHTNKYLQAHLNHPRIISVLNSLVHYRAYLFLNTKILKSSLSMPVGISKAKGTRSKGNRSHNQAVVELSP